MNMHLVQLLVTEAMLSRRVTPVYGLPSQADLDDGDDSRQGLRLL